MDKKDKQIRIRNKLKEIKPYWCRNLIVVIEDPDNFMNIGTIIRNVNALGVEKTYIVDQNHKIPDMDNCIN